MCSKKREEGAPTLEPSLDASGETVRGDSGGGWGLGMVRTD
jgi:hypothetical protein